jgi:hypothetical protein
VTPRDRYRRLCLDEPAIPLYSQDWWLDITCGIRRWDVLLDEAPSGRIRAAMPLYRPVRGIVTMPPFTQTMGTWFATADFAERQAIAERFAVALKDTAYFEQRFSPDVTDWLPFYWHGFRQTTRYTYVIDPIPSPADLPAGISKAKRRHIRQAQEQGLILRDDIPVSDFLLLYRHIFERQKLPPYHPQILERLINAAGERRQALFRGAYDADGHLHAALFILLHGDTAYCLAGGCEPVYRHTHANCLLLFDILQSLAGRCRRFDFEGSMMRGVEGFNREFGAIQTPYFSITKGRLTFLRRARIKLSRLRP